MERSGTLAEPSDNSTTPYIKKRPTLLGQPLLFVIHYLNNVLRIYNYFQESQTDYSPASAHIRRQTDADFSTSVFLVAGAGLEPAASGL